MSKKIRVTHLRTSHGIFGAERVILGLLRAFDTTAFDVGVTLVNTELGLNRDFSDELLRLGFELKNLQLRSRLDWVGVRELQRYIKKKDIQIIHCHDFKANFYGLMATLGSDVRRLTTVHGSTADSLLLRFYLAFNEFLLLRYFHKVIVVSPHLANRLRIKLLRTKKLAVIPNGVDANFFENSKGLIADDPQLHIPPGKIAIGTVGRLFPDKGHECLFEAISILQNEFPDLLLFIVGDGPHREYLQRRRNEMGLRGRVIFTGIRSNMKTVYDTFELFVMPSLREGLPMALLEAMLAETPVIATRVGGIPGLLGDGSRGIIVKPGDQKELAYAIKVLLLDLEKRRRMALDSAAFVRAEYSSEAMARRTEDVYRQVLTKISQ